MATRRHAPRQGTPAEIKVYPGVGHLFSAPDGKTEDKVPLFLATLRTDAFLDKHLKQGKPGAGAKGGK